MYFFDSKMEATKEMKPMNNLNPYAMMLELAKNNPNMKPIIEQIQNGANPEVLFRELCKQRNINPDEFVKDIKNKYGNIR
jgi:hypothetical protein